MDRMPNAFPDALEAHGVIGAVIALKERGIPLLMLRPNEGRLFHPNPIVRVPCPDIEITTYFRKPDGIFVKYYELGLDCSIDFSGRPEAVATSVCDLLRTMDEPKSKEDPHAGNEK